MLTGESEPEGVSEGGKVHAGTFVVDGVDALLRRSDLCELFLEHLLLLSMLQQPDRSWTWGRFVLVHPAANVEVIDQIERYRSFLADETSFDSMTVESLVHGAWLPAASAAQLAERYLHDRC